MLRMMAEYPHPISNTLWQSNKALRKASLTAIVPGSAPCFIKSNVSLIALFISQMGWKSTFQSVIKQQIYAAQRAAGMAGRKNGPRKKFLCHGG
jgi:hypothetical protein